jgi:hypothetical protein
MYFVIAMIFGIFDVIRDNPKEWVVTRFYAFVSSSA